MSRLRYKTVCPASMSAFRVTPDRAGSTGGGPRVSSNRGSTNSSSRQSQLTPGAPPVDPVRSGVTLKAEMLARRTVYNPATISFAMAFSFCLQNDTTHMCGCCRAHNFWPLLSLCTGWLFCLSITVLARVCRPPHLFLVAQPVC